MSSAPGMARWPRHPWSGGISLVLSAWLASRAAGQLSVERLYFHVNTPVAVRVTVPAVAGAAEGARGAGATETGPAQGQVPAGGAEPRAEVGEAGGEKTSSGKSAERAIIEIELLQPGEPGVPNGPGDVVARAPALEGGVDLAACFPVLWQGREPRVYLAQLCVNGVRVGPALVLQPMTTPKRAAPVDPRGLAVKFSPAGPDYFTGLRVYTDRRVLMQTSKGPLEIALRPDAAPNTAWNFRQLVEGGYYTGTTFHRVVATTPSGDAFMAQAGDPLGTGVGGPGYAIALEPSTLRHALGTVSMARLTQPDTGGGQFFIALSRTATASLDGGYCAFAQVVGEESAATLRVIAAARVDPRDKPVERIVIERAWLSDAPAVGSGSRPIVAPATPEGRGAGR